MSQHLPADMRDPESPERPPPAGVILEDYLEDVEVGLLKSGKEAEVYLVERRGPARSCLLAAKRYRSPETRAFKNDAMYRSHRRLDGLRRDADGPRRPSSSRATQLAMDKKTRYGRAALHRQWIATEYAALQRLWSGGVNVPYPVALEEDGLLMQYVGDRNCAAPRLSDARVPRGELNRLYEQLRRNMRAIVASGYVHADLSPFNLLVWEGELWVIDVPQAVTLLHSSAATELLHRDCVNVCAWFRRKGLEVDEDELFVELLDAMFRYQMEDAFLAKD